MNSRRTRRIDSVLAALLIGLLTVPALCEAGPPTPPTRTGPRLKEVGGQPSTGDASTPGVEGRLPHEVDKTFGVGAGLRVVNFIMDDLPVQGTGNVFFARLEATFFSVLLGVQSPGGYFYWGMEFLNWYAVPVYEISGFEISVLTPTLGLHGALVEDDVLVGTYTGLTGARVMTCTPICMRVDWRIPSFDFMYNVSREEDFDRSAAVSWGTAFEFAAMF